MQEHTCQVRGQARAPVGWHFLWAGFWIDGQLVSCLVAPHPNQPFWHQHFTRGINATDSYFGVHLCVCIYVCVCVYVLMVPCVVSGVHVWACVFLHTCRLKIILLLSFSSKQERCHVFYSTLETPMGFPSPASSLPPLSALLRVLVILLGQGLCGFRKQGPGSQSSRP